jgi:arginyl-tRNA synthetase
LASILRKAATDRALASGAIPDLSQLEEAGPILVRLGRFPDVVRSAARDAEPSQVSVYLLGLCRELNSWYAENRVLGVDPALSAARLGLIRASKQVLANGLRLLGLAAPEEM